MTRKPPLNYQTVTIKLTEKQTDVLDQIVDLGEYDGRSDAVRELVLPALNAGVCAINGESTTTIFATWVKGIHELNQRMKTMKKNASKEQANWDKDWKLPKVKRQDAEPLLPHIVVDPEHGKKAFA
jgi:hypothetical protein